MAIHDVMVVGAGASGLYAAYLLKNKGFHIQILEAAEQQGGRIRSLQTPWGLPVEAGAEFVHGKHSVLFDLVTHSQIQTFEVKEKDYLYFENQLLPYKKAKKKPLLKDTLTAINTLWKYKGKERSLQAYFENHGLYARAKNIIEAFAGEYGTHAANLGVKSLAYEEKLWSSGEKDYKLNIPLIRLFDGFYHRVMQDISFNTTVVDIDYAANEVILKDTRNRLHHAQKVILTIPLASLKNNLINFTPTLPPEKLQAIKSIGMDSNAIKAFLKFKKQFWKKKMNAIYGGNVCPEYYAYCNHEGKSTSTLTAYIMGKHAAQLSQYSNEEKTTQLIDELDLILGNSLASENFETSFIVDWGKEPFICGSYSYAAPQSFGQREFLAQAVGNKVYFAGEATNTNGHAASVHGAMESAERVVEEVEYAFNAQ